MSVDGFTQDWRDFFRNAALADKGFRETISAMKVTEFGGLPHVLGRQRPHDPPLPARQQPVARGGQHERLAEARRELIRGTVPPGDATPAAARNATSPGAASRELHRLCGYTFSSFA
jgi:hypothetical protein